MDGGMLNWSYETLTGFPKGKPALLTEKQDVEEVLKVALRLEKGSQDLYMQVAKKMVSPTAIAVFQRLAMAEEKHMDEIFNRYSTIFGQDRLATFRQLKPDSNTRFMEGGVEINKVFLELKLADVRDEMEALEVGLEIEYVAYDYYKRVAGMMPEVATGTLLHELAWEERRHINWLLIEINRLVKEKSS
jgi:rubrerythrin